MDYFVIEEYSENEWEIIADFQQSEVIKHSQVIDTESKRESNEAPEKILYEKDSRKVTFQKYENVDLFSEDFELEKKSMCMYNAKTFMIEHFFENIQVEIEGNHSKNCIHKTLEDTKQISDSIISATKNHTFQEKWKQIGDALKEKYGESRYTYPYTSLETANRQFQDVKITYRDWTLPEKNLLLKKLHSACKSGDFFYDFE